MDEERDGRTRWNNRHVGEYKVYKYYDDSLYHYTTRENLWNIINSNSFYARHVRFSNDSAEYEIGKKEIEKEINGSKLSDLDDCYMVCFCKNNNILSQWREYARGGVSLQMDFRNNQIFTIKCNEETEEQNRREREKKDQSPYFIPGGFFNDPLEYNVVYARPIAVQYIEEGKQALAKTIEIIKEENDEKVLEDDCLKQLLPYIKHKGFEEEREVRLVFIVDEINAEYMVDYLADKGMMRPYIRVEVGNAKKKQADECTIEYYKVPKGIIGKIKNMLKSGYFEIIDTHNKTKKIKITFREIDFKRAKNDQGHIFIESCKYQKYIFQMVDKYVSAYNIYSKKKICIWCDGFLPIRGITVGPSSDAQDLSESIAHKIKKKYWMKYVDVDVSGIPYRN